MINARLVDPRDVTQEVEQSTHRVTSWSQPPLPPGIPRHMPGRSSSDWNVQGGDLDEGHRRARYIGCVFNKLLTPLGWLSSFTS